MQEAIALTWSTLTARLRNLRAGAACAGLALLALILGAFLFRSGWMLLGLPVLMIIGFAFFRRDAALVFRWEDRVLSLWGASDLCMGILVQTLRDHPGPLKATLKGMISHLPPNPDYLTPPMEAIHAERCVFWFRSALQRLRLARAAVLDISLACIPWLAWACAREDMRRLPLALGPLLPVFPAWTLLAWIEGRRLANRMAGLAPWTPGARAEIAGRLRALAHGNLPGNVREKWIARIRVEVVPDKPTAPTGDRT